MTPLRAPANNPEPLSHSAPTRGTITPAEYVADQMLEPNYDNAVAAVRAAA